MKNWHISRRTFLRGATGAAMGLPLLEVMEPRSARAASKAKPPLRMGCVYLPNGVPDEAWRPKVDADGKLLELNEWMSPLEPLKDDLQFFAGLQSETKGSHPGAGATWLVRPCPEGDRISRAKNVGSPSMDQIVARAVGESTPFASLELISKPQGTFSKSLLRNNISWRNGTTPVPRETEPRAVYDRLTGQNSKSKNSGEASWQQSILDTVLADAKSLRTRVSASDQHKLDEYLDAVRSVEKQMSKMASASRASAREKAATFPRPPEGVAEDHRAYLRLMFDMMVLAYWTDSTRVATFMLDHEQSNRYFDFIPEVKGMWHAISHWRDISGKTEDDDGKTSWTSREVKFKQYLTIVKYHQEQVAYFLNRLKEIEEGDSTLLDNSMILFGSPFSDGNEHLSHDLPMLIAGKGGGKLATGRLSQYDGQAAEGVYLSMMDAMGVPVHEIGGIETAIPIT